MMKKYCVTFAALVCLLSLVSNDATPVPRLINYQGVLIDTSGAVMTGTHDLTFAIYADTSQSALALWSETHTGVDVDDGLFNAILGEITEIPDTLFASRDRWIGISVDAEPEMAPRQPITSVPWTFRAAHADSADSVAWGNIRHMPAGFADGIDDIGGVGDGHSLDAADGSPVDALYVDDTGKVGIGTTNPGSLLTLRGAYANMTIRSTGGSGSSLSFHCEPADEYIWTLGNLYHCGTLALNCGDLNVIHIHYGGNVGIGVLYWPAAKLDVNGTVKMTGFWMPNGAVSGRVLTTDDGGYGSWQPLPAGIGGSGTTNYIPKFTGTSSLGNSPMLVAGDSIGMGTWNPAAKLHVVTTGGAQAGYFRINNGGSGSNALHGLTNGGGYGVFGAHSSGYYGYLGGPTNGVYGQSMNNNRGALGTINFGVYGYNATGGVAGRFEGRVEITNNATISGGATITGNTTMNNNLTVSGTLTAGPTQINGNLNVTGTLTKGYGSFVIDHPLDPENKLLRHNFVESPENLLIYRGKVRLDDNGEAMVEMPDYFKALSAEENTTVSLTAIGKPFLTGYEWHSDLSRLMVYGERNREVAWVVYADRDDPVIHMLSRPVEEEKGPGKVCDRGELLYPKAYGYPETMAKRGQ